MFSLLLPAWWSVSGEQGCYLRSFYLPRVHKIQTSLPGNSRSVGQELVKNLLKIHPFWDFPHLLPPMLCVVHLRCNSVLPVTDVLNYIPTRFLKVAQSCMRGRGSSESVLLGSEAKKRAAFMAFYDSLSISDSLQSDWYEITARERT